MACLRSSSFLFFSSCCLKRKKIDLLFIYFISFHFCFLFTYIFYWLYRIALLIVGKLFKNWINCYCLLLFLICYHIIKFFSATLSVQFLEQEIIIGPDSYKPICIQLFQERLLEKMCTRQSRKVIRDMIDTIFLMTVAVEPTGTLVAFL